ncbi:MAG: lasso peptide biosynthesis B2 protein [Acidimicrobiales bacterium]
MAATTLLLALTRARPQRIRRILSVLGRGSLEADRRQAERAFAIVTTVSLRCASGHGCLRRSLAIIVLCRLWGVRATWQVGFRSPPPQSHAWVEAGGEAVCETVDPRTIYTTMITV